MAKKGAKVKENDYYESVNNKLPSSSHLTPCSNTELNSAIRKYKRKKQQKFSTSQIVSSSSNDIILSVEIKTLFPVVPVVPVIVPPPVVHEVIPPVMPLADPPEDVVEPLVEPRVDPPVVTSPVVSPVIIVDDGKPTAAKRSRGSQEFTTSFSRSYKDFDNLSDRQKKNITKPLIDMLNNFLDVNQFSLSLSDLLGYLINRETDQKESTVSFSLLEAVSFMHCLVLSKEQTRQVRYFLGLKNINFPTTNELLPVRKSLRPQTYPVLENKGRGVDYKELVTSTVTSVVKIVRELSPNQSLQNLTMYLKDGGDGAGTMPALKSKQAAGNEEEDDDHIFQYGIIPLKLTCGNETIWQNKVPNAARSLRPVYLIREVESDSGLLNFVVKETDQARKHLNTAGLFINVDDEEFHVSCEVKDSMKDLKFKKLISGLGGADCILCKSKAKDWTDRIKLQDGFKINRDAADTQKIFSEVLDENGNIRIEPGDFETRAGVTKEPISDSDQHCITITHSYINGTTWYLKMLYRCHADFKKWVEKAGYTDHLQQSKNEVRQFIKTKSGLKLDYVNSAGGKGGTSTDGKQGRRFYSDELIEVIGELLSQPHNIKHKVAMMKLHKQLSIILRIVSCTRKIDVVKFEQHCKDTMLTIVNNFPWAFLNHTLHGTVQHSAELIEMNGGESLGWYSEEGLEANNKDIRKYLERLSRKCDNNKQIEDVHHRLLERSDPYLIHLTSQYTANKLCTTCNATDHTVRSHDMYSSKVDGLEEFFI